MKPLGIKLLLMSAALLPALTTQAEDWMYRRSAYTHNPNTGERVTQYQQSTRVFMAQRPDYLQSGYSHNHIRIGRGSSAENIHITSEWGRRVRPYGEWRHPYRPYSVPYSLWGPSYGGNGYGYGPRGGYNRGYRGDFRDGQRQQGRGHQHQGGNRSAPAMPIGPT